MTTLVPNGQPEVYVGRRVNPPGTVEWWATVNQEFTNGDFAREVSPFYDSEETAHRQGTLMKQHMLDLYHQEESQ